MTMKNVKLIVGLGNPGSKYEATRHNAGFWFVDEIARQNNVVFRSDSKFFGDTARIQTNQQDFWLLKPNTFMNLSGQAIQAIANFYKISPLSILVAHDELDLETGIAKLKQSGGHGGHNGLRDTIKALGTKDFQRLRLGISHPGNSKQVVDYVLKAPSKIDLEKIEDAIYKAALELPNLLTGKIEQAMHSLHTN